MATSPEINHSFSFTSGQQRTIDRALALLQSRLIHGDALSSPRQVRQYCRLQLAGQCDEYFACLFLTSQHTLIAFEPLFRGTISGAAVYRRVVVRLCLELNADAVILVHNHPSGVSEPSLADRQITERLQGALGLIDVRVLDHLIVAAGDATSFADLDLL